MMSDVIEKPSETIPELERVTDATLYQYWEELRQRLKAGVFKYVDDSETLNWLRSVLTSNEYLFVHRGPVFALAMRISWPLEPPHVRLVFVSGPNDTESIGALMVEDVVTWAEGLHAIEVVIEAGVAVDKKAIMQHIELRDRREVFHRIKRAR